MFAHPGDTPKSADSLSRERDSDSARDTVKRIMVDQRRYRRRETVIMEEDTCDRVLG